MRRASLLFVASVAVPFGLFAVGTAACSDDTPPPGALSDGGGGTAAGAAGSNAAGASGGGASAGASAGGASGGAGASGASAGGEAGAGAGAAGAATAGAGGEPSNAGAAGAGTGAGAGGGVSGNAGAGGSAGTGGVGDAGAAGAAGDSGAAGEGGAPPVLTGGTGGIDAGGSAGSAPFGACADGDTYAAGVSESVSTEDADTLAAITPDERTLLFFKGTDETHTLFVADRDSATASWSTPVEIPAALGPFALDRVALESNGLVLGVLRSDRTAFVELRRDARGAAFAAGTMGTFANLSQGLPDGATLADPVVGESDATMFFSVIAPGVTTTLHTSIRFNPTAVWPSRSPVNVAELAASGSARKRPTGLSGDGRTLFYWDETAAKTRRAVRGPGALATFDTFTDLGTQQAVQPAASCKRIYYSAPGATTLDLFHADTE